MTRGEGEREGITQRDRVRAGRRLELRWCGAMVARQAAERALEGKVRGMLSLAAVRAACPVPPASPRQRRRQQQWLLL
jgi:hypothetical protein